MTHAHPLMTLDEYIRRYLDSQPPLMYAASNANDPTPQWIVEEQRARVARAVALYQTIARQQ